MTELAPNLRLEFRLTGMGWAELQIEVNEHVHMVAGISDCTSALDDLLLAAIKLAVCPDHASAEAQSASVTFDGEPILTQFELVPEGGHSRPRCYQLKVSDKRAVGHEARNIFSESIGTSDTFAQVVLDMAERLFLDIGADRYAELWQVNPFPVRALAALRAALSEDVRRLAHPSPQGSDPSPQGSDFPRGRS